MLVKLQILRDNGKLITENTGRATDPLIVSLPTELQLMEDGKVALSEWCYLPYIPTELKTAMGFDLEQPQ